METSTTISQQNESMLSYNDFRNEVLKDYRIILESREASLLGRREVLTGKAKFGIFGDGKELAQVAMAKFFKAGDWRSAITATRLLFLLRALLLFSSSLPNCMQTLIRPMNLLARAGK